MSQRSAAQVSCGNFEELLNLHALNNLHNSAYSIQARRLAHSILDCIT
jgi:hypothetical protein